MDEPGTTDPSTSPMDPRRGHLQGPEGPWDISGAFSKHFEAAQLECGRVGRACVHTPAPCSRRHNGIRRVHAMCLPSLRIIRLLLLPLRSPILPVPLYLTPRRPAMRCCVTLLAKHVAVVR